MEFGKKKGLSELEKKAKLAALSGANKMATDALKGNLKGMKKVEVVSNDKAGLQHGLKKAEELISGSKMEEDGDDADERVESGESRDSYLGDELEHMPDADSGSNPPDSDESEFDDCSEEDLDAKIEHLLGLKAKLKSKE